MDRFAFRMLVVILLVASSMALLRMSAILGPNTMSGGGSVRASQTVRSYYSALNYFLSGGELDDLVQFVGTSDSLLPTGIWWEEDHPDWSTTIHSLGSTFPDLQFELEETWSAGDLVLARTMVRNGEAQLPYWLNGGASLTVQPSIEAFQVMNDQIVAQWSSARPPVMFHPLVPTSQEFRLDTPAVLTVTELTIVPSGRGPRYVSLTAPGVAIPVSGQFAVEGNGLARISSSRDGASRLIPNNEKVILAAPQMLVMPLGKTVIWLDGGEPAKVMLLSLVSTSPELWTRDSEHNHLTLDSLLEVIRRESNSHTEPWFGPAHVLARSSAVTLPGMLSLDLTQVVVPPGESLHINGRDFQVVMFESSGSAVLAEIAGTENYIISEVTDRTRVLLIIRVCSLGFSHSDQANCAASELPHSS